jgi:hypothetical protein
MTLLHHDHRPDAEASVRAMLQRLAADALVRPPAWEDLLERPEAEVVPLAVSGSISEVAVRRRRIDLRPFDRRAADRRPRIGVAAAAAVLVVAAVGGLAVSRAGSGPARPPVEAISAISPGDPAFDPGAAAAVWATGLADPVAATQSYLAAMGVPAAATPATVALRGTAGTTAVVDWSLDTAAGGGRGTVYLRASAPGTPPAWTVVGAAADDLALGSVRYDGSRLSFTVTRTTAGSEQVAVGAWIDGQPVSLGGEPVAWAGSSDVSLGELVELGTAADATGRLSLPAAPDDVVTLRVVRVVDGTVRSLTQMAVALPDAAPDLVAAGAPPVDAGGGATSSAGAGVDGTGATAGAEGEAGGSGGVQLPGGTVPGLPALPPLPVPLPNLLVPGTPVPTLPGAPAVTLPAPPSTLGLG